MSIEKALGKLRAAQMCHPNAVQALIDEAITAIQQAEDQQAAATEPVGFTYQAEIAYADSTGGNGSFWRVPPDLDDEAVPLYTHPAPSAPADVVRDAERYRLIRDGSGWPAVFAAHDAPEPLRGDDLDAARLTAKDTK